LKAISQLILARLKPASIASSFHASWLRRQPPEDWLMLKYFFAAIAASCHAAAWFRRDRAPHALVAEVSLYSSLYFH